MSSNLVRHARTELELIGEEPEVIEGYLKIIQAFADMGHSGGSASVAIPTINQLLQFKRLAPLTDKPEDWVEVGDGLYQSRRQGSCFSRTGGVTYYDLDEERRWLYYITPWKLYRKLPLWAKFPTHRASNSHATSTAAPA